MKAGWNTICWVSLLLLTEIKRNTQEDFPILTRTKQGII